MSRKLIDRIVQVSFHRNGVGGAGFHAVLFETTDKRCSKCKGHDSYGWESTPGIVLACPNCQKPGAGERLTAEQWEWDVTTTLMVASVFDEPGHVAVFAVGKLSEPDVGVAFGENSYRGDRYEPELRAAIAIRDSDGSVRVGPFGLPTKRKGKGK